MSKKYKNYLKLAFAVLSIGLLSIVATLITLNLLIGNKSIDRPLASIYGVGSQSYERTMSQVLEPAIVEGNSVQALVNGDQIFPAMLSAIQAAQKTITLETYIYWSGDIGQQFARALEERARQGVKINILIDWYGSEMTEESFVRMRSMGVLIHKYNPPTWTTLNKINHRTHRRLLIVDGVVGFIGGAGLSEKWSGHAQGPDHWRDTHFRIEGPAVGQLQSAFLDNWIQTTGRVPRDEGFLPPHLESKGTSRMHVFKASPGGGSKSMQLMYLLAMSSARKSIDLSAAYFLPDEVALQTLVEAMKRGVRVRVIMPGPYMDRKLVQRSSRAKWDVLLSAGAELYQYQPTMFHCKVMVVDGQWASVGSTNFDTRSFSINDEANLNVFDVEFAQTLTSIFENDLRSSKRFTLSEWSDLPWWTKAIDKAATVLDSQL